MRTTAPVQILPDDPFVPDILDLVRRSFAYMEPRINPPSSMHRMTIASIQDQCKSGEVWTIGDPPVACIFLTDKKDRLYVGKLTVDETMRGKGLARQLIDLANTRAKNKGLPILELHTRIELTENHETFQKLGFSNTGEGRHDGFDRPTYIIMQKPVET